MISRAIRILQHKKGSCPLLARVCALVTDHYRVNKAFREKCEQNYQKDQNSADNGVRSKSKLQLPHLAFLLPCSNHCLVSERFKDHDLNYLPKGQIRSQMLRCLKVWFSLLEMVLKLYQTIHEFLYGGGMFVSLEQTHPLRWKSSWTKFGVMLQTISIESYFLCCVELQKQYYTV